AVLSYGFVDFYNNTVVATDTLSPYGDNSGVYQAGDGGSDGVMTVKNNIFVDNYVGMIRAGDSFLYASNNLYFNNETDALSVTADDGNNVTADPMFVDGANGDYRLLAGSPAIDAGVDVGLPYEGAAPDMGAYEGEGITGIAENGGEIPRTFALKQNFPNPFNPTTMIEYDLPKLTHVKLIIYNSLGQEVKVLVDKHQSSGSFKVEWNGRDKYGNRLSSGFYFCRIQADGFVKTSKMLLLK
ncbi:MAG: FlgD immunoglobulin-like domain containing protein, partial [Calditrichia bacterium]